VQINTRQQGRPRYPHLGFSLQHPCSRGGQVEVMGQRLLNQLGQLVALKALPPMLVWPPLFTAQRRAPLLRQALIHLRHDGLLSTANQRHSAKYQCQGRPLRKQTRQTTFYIRCHLQCPQSLATATTGSSLAALWAGAKPKIKPVKRAQPKANKAGPLLK